MKTPFGDTWRLLRPHARPQLPILGLVILLGAITATAQGSVILLFVPIWNRVLFPGTESAAEVAAVPEATRSRIDGAFDGLASWAAGYENPAIAMLVGLTLIAMLLSLVAGLSQWGYTWFARRVGFEMIVDLRVRIARHLMGLSLRYHGQRKFGDLLSRVSADVQVMLQAVNIGLKSLVEEPLMALAAFVMMLIVAPYPTLGIAVILPIALWPVSMLTKKVRKGSKKSLTSLGASVQALAQMFQGIRTVKSFGGEERELERYRELNRGYLRSSMKMVRAVSLAHAWTAFYSIAGIAVLMLVFGWIELSFGGFNTGGDMATFFILVARLNNHVKNFTKALTRVQESVGASERIKSLLDEPEDVVERAHPQSITTIGTGVRFENVTFQYPNTDRPALRDVELEIRPGETLALVGPSGSGKSTLMDLVARFIDPTGGRVTADEKDLRDVSLSGWTSLYAMVGQAPFLFHATVAENIGYGKEGASRAEIEDAARIAGMHEFIASLPEGYDTDVADMGTRLSGGQRQRITIARAVLKGAPLLLLDEATSALDSQSEADVQEALNRLMVDRTVLVIAHRIATVQNADRVAVLEDGRLVELGRHDELVAQGGLYARLCALQNLEAPASELAGPTT